MREPPVNNIHRHKYIIPDSRNAEATVETTLGEHNAGSATHTWKHRRWQLRAAIEFVDPASAVRFEKHLESGSGRAFARRHL
jgi:hypothetical protein